jgi:hypothetical protein
VSRLQGIEEDGMRIFLKNFLYFTKLASVIVIFSHWRYYLIHFSFPLRAYSGRLGLSYQKILFFLRPLIIDKIGIFNFGRNVSVTLNPTTYA